MIRFFTLGIFLSALPAAAQEYLIGGYTAFIGPEDLYNSSGTRLTDPVQILRQDRANVHRFGIIHQGDEGDPWFVQPDARAAMAGMFRNGGGVPTYAAPLIVQGNVPVYVTIYGTGGNFTSLRVDIPG